MSFGPSDLVRVASGALGRSWNLAAIARAAKDAVRYVSTHTGVPAMVVAAVLLCVGYRVLKRSARFAFEVVAVAFLLAAATRFGWIHW